MLRTYIELQWKHGMQIFQVFETCACLLKNNNRQDQFFWATKNEQSKQTIFFFYENCWSAAMPFTKWRLNRSKFLRVSQARWPFTSHGKVLQEHHNIPHLNSFCFVSDILEFSQAWFEWWKSAGKRGWETRDTLVGQPPTESWQFVLLFHICKRFNTHSTSATREQVLG